VLCVRPAAATATVAEGDGDDGVTAAVFAAALRRLDSSDNGVDALRTLFIVSQVMTDANEEDGGCLRYHAVY
jgi:hypothetical protein